MLLGLLRAVASVPHHSLPDGFAYVRGLLASQSHFLGANLEGPLMTVDLGRQDTTFALPMFVIDGAEDNYTPAAVAREYFDTITAPRKEFIAIPGAATWRRSPMPKTSGKRWKAAAAAAGAGRLSGDVGAARLRSKNSSRTALRLVMIEAVQCSSSSGIN